MLFYCKVQYFKILESCNSSILENAFYYLGAFSSNTICNWLNHLVWPIRSCVTFKIAKSCRKRQRMF